MPQDYEYWMREETEARRQEYLTNDHAEKARWHKRRWDCMLKALEILENRP